MMRNETIAVVFLVLSGCSSAPSTDCLALVVDHSVHPNSASFSWVTAEAATLSVSYRVADGPLITRMISDAPSTGHEGSIHGLTSLSEVEYTMVAAFDDGTASTCQGSFTTDNLPPELPDLTVEIYDADQVSSERFFIGVSMNSEATFPFIINRTGEVVWYGDSADYYSAAQVEVARDGRGLLVGSYAFNRETDVGTLHRVSLFGEVLEETPLPGGHHFFKQISEDTVAYPSVDIREWSYNDALVDVVGDALVEIDSDSATEVFNSWDDLQPVVHDHFWGNFYPQGSDWTHLNSIDYRASQDRYIISLPFMKSILVIDAKTGDILEDYSDRTYTFEGDPLQDAHDVRLIDDNTLTLINHYPNVTRAVEYTIDRTAQTITPTWAFEDGVRATFMGQFFRLENGNRLINYGSAGVIQEVTPSGEVVWEVQSALGSWFGNGQMITSIYEAAQ
jgi:hypothetical protein